MLYSDNHVMSIMVFESDFVFFLCLHRPQLIYHHPHRLHNQIHQNNSEVYDRQSSFDDEKYYGWQHQ